MLNNDVSGARVMSYCHVIARNLTSERQIEYSTPGSWIRVWRISRDSDSGLTNRSRTFDAEYSNIRRQNDGGCSTVPVFPAHRGFSLIDDFTPKFIEINGTPSFFYVTDCYIKHYDAQISLLITKELNLWIATSSFANHQAVDNLVAIAMSVNSTWGIFLKSGNAVCPGFFDVVQIDELPFHFVSKH